MSEVNTRIERGDAPSSAHLTPPVPSPITVPNLPLTSTAKRSHTLTTSACAAATGLILLLLLLPKLDQPVWPQDEGTLLVYPELILRGGAAPFD